MNGQTTEKSVELIKLLEEVEVKTNGFQKHWERRVDLLIERGFEVEFDQIGFLYFLI